MQRQAVSFVVIVRLSGGLGNQLFQYAAGRAVAVHRGDILKLDIANIQRDPQRSYRLDRFHVSADIASDVDMKMLKACYLLLLPKRLPRRVRMYIPDRHLAIVRERYPNQYDPVLFESEQPHIHLIGYWQNIQYLERIEPLLRKEFEISLPPDTVNAEMLQQIRQVEAVSLHVRRGDYVSNPVVNQHHGTCSVEYYLKAVSAIAEQVREPEFYVFSDDIPWSQENLRLPFPTHFVAHNGPDKDYEDLRLMQNCKYHILANSTFSWWAAWLCDYPQKIVVGPKTWFSAPDRSASGLFPVDWVQI